MHLRSFALLSIMCLAVARSARAQTTPTEIARRELIEQAEAARAESNHGRALELASRALQIRVTPSLRLLLAQEHSALGHVLEALDQANGCAREAAIDPVLHNRERIVDACRALAATLAAQVGHIIVRVPSPSEGLTVRVAGTEVVAALWGEPFPVVPGSVEVDALAANGARFHATSDVRPGENVTVDVVLGPAPVRAPVVPVVTVAAPTMQPVVRRPVDGAQNDLVRVSHGAGAGPWVFIGLGAAALATSLVFYFLRDDALASRNAQCGLSGLGGTCFNNAASRALGEGYDRDYRTYSTLTPVALGVGAASVVVGGLWLLLGRRTTMERRPQHATAMSVTPTPGGALFELRGAL